MQAAAEQTSCPVSPLVLAIVNATGDHEFLDNVKAALLGALEALPACAHLGLITFHDQASQQPPTPCVSEASYSLHLGINKPLSLAYLAMVVTLLGNHQCCREL